METMSNRDRSRGGFFGSYLNLVIACAICASVYLLFRTLIR